MSHSISAGEGFAETRTVSVDFEEREGGAVFATPEVRRVTSMAMRTQEFYKLGVVGVTEELWRRTSENPRRISDASISFAQRLLWGSIDAAGKPLALGSVLPPVGAGREWARR